MKLLAVALALTLSLSVAAGAAEKTGLTATPLLDSNKTGEGLPLAYPGGPAHVSGLLVELAPGAETGKHRHPMPVIGYIIEGEVTVTADGMAPRVFKAGDAFVETNAWHNGRNTGTVPVKILAFYLGSEGQLRVIKPTGGDGHY